MSLVEKMACKALFHLQKYDASHIWMFIFLWKRASRNGLIRLSAFVLLHLPSLVQRAIQLYHLKKRARSMTFTVLRDRAKTTSVRLTEQESTLDREGISAHALILGAAQRTRFFWARFLLRLSVPAMGQPVFQLPRPYESGSISYPISIPRGTTTHAGGKLFVATRDTPNKVRGEAYCIGYIDAPERSYGVYQIHIKIAFSTRKLVLSLLFVLDNNVFHKHEEWNASPCAIVNGQYYENSPALPHGRIGSPPILKHHEQKDHHST